MPINIVRPGGAITPLINSEYLPMYYLFPKEFLDRAGVKLSGLPRNPKQAIYDKSSREIIESDLFLLLMIDGIAAMVWPYMGIKGKREIYSGYEPGYILAHSPAFWVQELIDLNLLPTDAQLIDAYGSQIMSYPSIEETSAIMQTAVASAMKKHRMHEVIEIAREYRCFKDFDYRQSFAKQDFYRKWYHTRTRHPIVSLEGMAYSKSGEKTGFELVDTPFEEYVEAEVDADAFKKTLTENDMRILTMRTQGMTYEEIARRLGYKNHSGVLKRIQKIAAQYEAYSESLIN